VKGREEAGIAPKSAEVNSIATTHRAPPRYTRRWISNGGYKQQVATVSRKRRLQKGHEHMTADRFATVINCLDGEVQEPVSTWLKTYANATYVDVITAYAPERVLTAGSTAEIASIQDAVRHSMRTHDLHVLAVAGHADCEGDPVIHTEQIARIQQAIAVVTSWGVNVPVIGMWVDIYGQVELVNTAPFAV
jgi:hypothetical protein